MKPTALHPLFAAELTGCDLSQPPDDRLVKIVEEAMAKYAVVVIRGQSHISDGDQVRFARAFGPLELPHGTTTKGTAKPKRIAAELYDASNLTIDDEIAPPTSIQAIQNKGNELFHMDSSFHSMPTKWSMLLGHRVTKKDGQTEFSDTRAACEALPKKLREKIEGRQAEHNVWVSRERIGFEGNRNLATSYPPVAHDIIQRSASGRECLWVGSHADYIIGMDKGEGRALLDAVTQFASQDRFVYSHKWQQGDLVIWDNRCTLHRARAFDFAGEKRDLRRATISESGPEISAVEANQISA